MDKNIKLLITGGTGSFGNAVLKNFLKTNIKEIRIFSRDEKKQDDLRNFYKDKRIKFYIGDTRDSQAIDNACQDVNLIFHAAALKQVPSCEFYPMEAIKTNIIGTENLLDAAIKHKVKKVICLSTDKAVYPINAMGLSKSLMEKVSVAKSRSSIKTIINTTRYGNVIGSRGSVLPLFIKLINEKSKFLPITHKDMTRFWITLEQGVNFVVDSFKKMHGGEIFIPKMPSIKMVDLAKSLDTKIRIDFVGIRPGEKLHEVLVPSDLSSQTFEDKYSFTVLPSFSVNKKNRIYNFYKKKFKLVNQGFEYNSENNSNYLNINQIKKLNKEYTDSL